MTKTFSARAWAANEPLYETILSMPFNAALADGTLEPARFRHYMLQDALYLEGFARALALISARAPDLMRFSISARPPRPRSSSSVRCMPTTSSALASALKTPLPPDPHPSAIIM